MVQAAILGLIQGLAEFLPISSSAHLVLVPWLFNWPDPGLTFDIALHVGTLLAVVIFFWRDWINLIVKGFTEPRGREGRFLWFIAFASVPGALIGFLLEKQAETIFRSPLLIAVMLIAMGIVLYWADRRGTKTIGMEAIDLKTSLYIGLSQALAIIPGVSRSGVTMTTGLALGLSREGAARFSFLLSTPIILGAALVKTPQLIANPSVVNTEFLLGTVVSAVTGMIGIGFLLRYLR
ncbi:MAG: undecaprenyl-diphosphate phosphatase, partial [Smithellaceae bacterium]|nr:undecaprenyl-diphosphate phosphatase [Smithellaceae bacterium]